MTTTCRAAIECNAQNSVKCHGVIGVTGDPAALTGLAAAKSASEGWRREYPMRWDGPTHDVCPACQAGLAEAPPASEPAGKGAA